jgi:hypothetical protein
MGGATVPASVLAAGVFLFLRRKKKIPATTATMSATPPMEPPAMAPVLDLLGDEVAAAEVVVEALVVVELLLELV